MPIIFGRNIPDGGSDSELTIESDSLEFFHGSATQQSGSGIVTAFTLAIQRPSFISLGIYYLTRTFEFQLEASLSALVIGDSDDNLNIIASSREIFDDNVRLNTRLIGKGSQRFNKTTWTVDESRDGDGEPSLPRDPVLTETDFSEKSQQSSGPISISCLVANASLRLNCSASTNNDNDRVFGILSSSSEKSSYTLVTPSKEFKGTWS